jgi:hypothetical protein
MYDSDVMVERSGRQVRAERVERDRRDEVEVGRGHGRGLERGLHRGGGG